MNLITHTHIYLYIQTLDDRKFDMATNKMSNRQPFKPLTLTFILRTADSIFITKATNCSLNDI